MGELCSDFFFLMCSDGIFSALHLYLFSLFPLARKGLNLGWTRLCVVLLMSSRNEVPFPYSGMLGEVRAMTPSGNKPVVLEDRAFLP